MSIRIKKKLLSDTNKLPARFHEQIFEKLLNHDINLEYNSNRTHTFIDLNSIDPQIVDELIEFVGLCHSNIKYNKERAFLYQKAKENIDEVFTNDYDLDDIMERSSGVKIMEENKKIL